MFILVNPNTSVLVKITDECIPVTFNKGNNIECKDENATAYISKGLVYPKSLPLQMYEVDNIPQEVEPYKYLYTIKNGFVINTKYKEPEDIYTSLSIMENELNNTKKYISELDSFNIKTNINKTLEVPLYLKSGNYYIGENSKLKSLLVNSVLNIGTDYYIKNNGEATLNTLTIDNGINIDGPTSINGVLYTNNIIYFNSNETTDYYIGADGSANFLRLNIHDITYFENAVNFTSSNAPDYNRNNYYINNGNAVLNKLSLYELNVSNFATFESGVTFKHSINFNNGNIDQNGNASFSSIYIGSGRTTGTIQFGTSNNYNITAAGVAKFSSITDTGALSVSGTSTLSTTTVSTLNIGKSGTTSVYSYLHHPLMLGTSLDFWINQNGNGAMKALRLEGKLTLNSASILNAQFTLGTSKSPNTKKEYYINGVGNGSFHAVWADACQVWSFTNSSSRRFKDNIVYRDNNYWHDKLMQIKPCTFNYKSENKDNIHAGIIAEDLIKILPEFVELDGNGECNSIKILDIITLLVSEAQRSNSIIENMQKEINELKNKI